MKRKGILVFICVVILLLLGALAFLQGKSIAVGRCAVTEDGTVFWVNQYGVPTAMNGAGKWMASSLKTGDKIFLIHSRQMAMSYPGQVAVYFCFKIGDGFPSDLPENTIEEFTAMGYDLTE